MPMMPDTQQQKINELGMPLKIESIISWNQVHQNTKNLIRAIE